jgi:hypothetical protein
VRGDGQPEASPTVRQELGSGVLTIVSTGRLEMAGPAADGAVGIQRPTTTWRWRWRGGSHGPDGQTASSKPGRPPL